ncbi:PIN-like domain-containing protein [Priestia megaterium]|uniref:PIN-like domain-containing protein n=1 Tax=Priestia megaterium TaxID=1404 RepID=UPI003CEE0C14
MTNLILFDEFKDFLDNDPIIIIDSCSILDLYRYAPHTSKRILENLGTVSENIWIPAQVFEEYSMNKKSVVKRAHSKYKLVSTEVVDIIKKAETDISKKFIQYGKFKYPKIKKLKDELNVIIDQLKDKAQTFKDIVSEETKENQLTLSEDDVELFIQALKGSNQIGLPLSLPEKISIYQEGEFRYKHFIPPGYMDISKDKSDPTKLKKYGDLIIWKELLIKAKEENKPVIFITDDEKADWWELKIINQDLGTQEVTGPRKELLSEFNAYSGGKDFLMLTLPELNQHISVINHANQKEVIQNYIELFTEEVVKEIIDVKTWEDIVDISELTTSFIHDGELQEFLGEILKDVEIESISDPEFDELYADINEEEVIIDGSFKCIVHADIETALSSEYSETVRTTILLTGNITVEFNINYDSAYEMASGRENDMLFIEPSLSDVHISSTEISKCTFKDKDNNDYSDIACVSCKVRPGDYFTIDDEPICSNCIYHFDVCTGCGKLYEYNSLGGYICDKCKENEN